MDAILRKQRLSPAQARTVSDRRYADARALCNTKRNSHANGAMYLAGIALELLLKARLIEKHPWLAQAFGDPAKRTRSERALFELCYVRHDLEGLLIELTEVIARLAAVQGTPRTGMALLQSARGLCAAWTIHIRYATQQADMAEANEFLNRFAEVRRWLR